MGRIGYDRDEELGASIEWEASSAPPIGSPSMLLRTFAESAYPTVANRVYACRPVLIDAVPAEGSVASTTVGDGIVYAANLGTGIPPADTFVLAARHGATWVFRYDA